MEPQDCEARAKSAGLVYIQSFDAGYRRQKCGRGFKYVDESGRVITSKTIRQRLVDLVIPPAWTDVWICRYEDGHIQATGLDKVGRKQYIYHSKWHESSASHKYGRLRQFADWLPAIRRRVRADMNAECLSKQRVLAAVVRLLDKASVRIGNRQYLHANDSRGATTLTVDHVSRNSDEVSLAFKGKSGKQIEITCNDGGLASVIEDCENADGEFLFSYQNDAGEYVSVTSSDVNAYLLEITNELITAKDFRTWRGSVIALSQLTSLEKSLSPTARKRAISAAIRAAAEALGNTPAVCRKSYIHSAILSSAESGKLTSMMKKLERLRRPQHGLTRYETRLLLFLIHIERKDGKAMFGRPEKSAA